MPNSTLFSKQYTSSNYPVLIISVEQSMWHLGVKLTYTAIRDGFTIPDVQGDVVSANLTEGLNMIDNIVQAFVGHRGDVYSGAFQDILPSGFQIHTTVFQPQDESNIWKIRFQIKDDRGTLHPVDFDQTFTSDNISDAMSKGMSGVNNYLAGCLKDWSGYSGSLPSGWVVYG